MALHLGDTAPDFSADSSAGPIAFHEWAGENWVVFFSHPADFTPVCTTELGRVAQLKDEWDKRGVKTIALSVDSAQDHAAWIPDIEQYNATSVEYPIIADPDKSVAELYDMIHPGEGDTSRHRPGQEGSPVDDLPQVHGTQLPRDPARRRRPAGGRPRRVCHAC